MLRGAGVAGVSWLTPLADILAAEAEKAPKGKPAKSLILLWLGGAASQLDTFDPHPTTEIGGGVKAELIVDSECGGVGNCHPRSECLVGAVVQRAEE